MHLRVELLSRHNWEARVQEEHLSSLANFGMLRSGCLRPGAPRGLLQPPQRVHLRHRRCSLQATCSAVAEPAVVEVKAFSGEAVGSERLSLKVADPYTAAGLVHRTVVTHRQNARRVRSDSKCYAL
jgi:hypothetical protein